MSRRLVLGTATAALIAGALAGSALASQPSVSQTSHKVCLMVGDGSGILAPGYCVGWDGGPSLVKP